MAPGLLDMPENVMNKIIKDVGIKAIFTLRKVCHDMRNYIDDVKSEANWESIYISVHEDYLFLTCEVDGGEDRISYNHDKEGCLIWHQTICCTNDESTESMEKEYLLKNENFINVFLKDMELILTHQKTILKTLDFEYFDSDCLVMNNTILENLERILKSRNHPLQVEMFKPLYMDQNQIMLILPYLDSKTLITLDLLPCKRGIMEVDQLVKLDHWRSVQHISLHGSVDYEYNQHFTHFMTGHIRFEPTHFPDLVLLKDIFLQSPGIQMITVYSAKNCHFDDIQKSTDSLRTMPLVRELDNKLIGKSWFYRIPASEKILHLIVKHVDSLTCPSPQIELTRIKENGVPQELIQS